MSSVGGHFNAKSVPISFHTLQNVYKIYAFVNVMFIEREVINIKNTLWRGKCADIFKSFYFFFPPLIFCKLSRNHCTRNDMYFTNRKSSHNSLTAQYIIIVYIGKCVQLHKSSCIEIFVRLFFEEKKNNITPSKRYSPNE